MTAFGWALLGIAALLTPASDPAQRRAATLAARGRLAVARSTGRRLPMPGVDVLAYCGCAAVTVGVVVSGGVALGGAAAIGSATAVRLLRAARSRRAAERVAADLLAALRLLAAELEAGARPEAAFLAAAGAGHALEPQFRAAAAALHDGRDPPLDAPQLRPLAAALTVAGRTGAPLATVVRRVAEDCSARVAQRRAVRAATAGAQSSAVLLAGLPALGLLLGAAMQAHPLAVLIGTPAGRVVCLIGIGLDAAGLLWTQRLTTRAEAGA
jgi:tight adherence protein B